jgi:ABC-type transporter Mla MlaB component
MLRIARVDAGPTDSVQTLTLEGRLLGLWVDELSRFCEEQRISPSDLRLDLSSVTFIDSAGVKLLDDLTRRGATIVGCSGFINEPLSGSSSQA